MKNLITLVLVFGIVVASVVVYQTHKAPTANPELDQVNAALNQANALQAQIAASQNLSAGNGQTGDSANASAETSSSVEARNAQQLLSAVQSVLVQLSYKLQSQSN